MYKKQKIKLGKRKQLKNHGWISGYVKPCGKYWKRIASKRVRQSRCVNDGCGYRKLFGWFERC